MAKIEKLKKGTSTIYPATIPQAVVDPTDNKTLSTKLTEIDDSVSQLAGEVSQKASHGYVSNPKTLKEVEDNASVKLTNLLQNSSFENGVIKPIYKADGSEGASTLSINTINPISGNYDARLEVATPATTTNRPILYLNGSQGGWVLNHIFYFGMSVKVNNGTPIIANAHNGDGGKTLNLTLKDGFNSWTVECTGLDNFALIYLDSRTLWDFNFDNLIAYDLTAIFGAGNEPTAEEMNLLISTLGIDYFEGEITIPAQKIMQWQLKLANTSAQNADDARLAIQDDLALKADQTELDQLTTLANQADAKAEQANVKLITEETTTWELANDLTFFTSNYGYKNLGQYTKVLTEAVAFSQVRLNLVDYSGGVQYKVCIVTGIASGRDCPVGPISPTTHTIIKEGILTMTTGYKDYFIDLGNVFTCPIGSQVAIYMVSVSGNTINMRGISYGEGNPEKTSNAALFSSADEPFDGGSWVRGTVIEETNIGYYNVALSLLAVPLFMAKENLDEEIQEQVELLVPDIIKPDIKLTIPDKVYAVVGTELNLWNDAVSLSVDKGLSSPLNYQVRWYCTKGLVTDRCFRFTPTDLDVGTVSCTCYIYDMRGSLIDSKTFSIIVSAKNAIAATKNIVYFGDSLGAGAATALYDNFNNVDKFTGIIPIMQGTNGNTFGYEAVGGYRWEDYATAGRKAYRVFVTGVGSIDPGSKYTNNGYTWTIVEVNVTDGNGNLLITTFAPQSYPDAPEINGTLTPVSTGVDITYTNASLMGANPLWDNDTNQLDIALYKTRIGLSPTDKIDAVSFQFGINDSGLANDLTTLMTYISDLYNAFIADNPLCKFIIGLTTSSGNDVNGSGANYGASNDYLTYLSNTYKIRQFYLTLQYSVQYPNIIIAPISLGLDRYYGYGLSERAISQRVPTLEKYHSNYVHPGSSGYGQMADMYFGAYIYALTQ